MTGSELKQKREKLEISQEKLAQALDVAVSTVARWEQLKEGEIPNSRMLELSISALELTNKNIEGSFQREFEKIEKSGAKDLNKGNK